MSLGWLVVKRFEQISNELFSERLWVKLPSHVRDTVLDQMWSILNLRQLRTLEREMLRQLLTRKVKKYEAV